MISFRRLTTAALATALLAGVTSTNAAAAAEPFGEHVAMCAHALGQRAGAPAVTCMHDGMTMTFATFGAMVKHMQTVH